MFYALILVTVFLTSLLSGIVGMAGGMILMAVLVSLSSVAGAMILHGAVQATANGSRAWFLRQHLRSDILPNYAVGAGIAVAVFMMIAFVPDPGVVLVLVGLFPWFARLSKRLKGLDVLKPLTAISCGVVVTAAQLLAGASGPLLDVFYHNTPLTRREIVANKAVTQTLGHFIKILYYGFFIGVAVQFDIWLIAIAMTIAVAGTRAGTMVLEKWSDAQFQKVSQIIILTIATLCFIQGIRLLLT
jgi:uncharacterized protein